MKLHTPAAAAHVVPRMRVQALAAAMVGLIPCAAQALVNVRAGVADSPFEVATNAGNRADPQVDYVYTLQTPVPNALPPLFGLVRGTAEADGSAGTLRARVEINNPGPGQGVIPGARLNMAADMSESIQLFATSGGGTRNVGTVGLGDPTDDFVTVRASGVLHGAGAVGSATGVPPGVNASRAGSTRAVFSLGLGINSGNLITLVQTESTSLGSVDNTRTESPFNINLGNGYIDGDSVIMNISKSFLSSNSNTTIHFSAGLRVEARGGSYSGSQVVADYTNTAYVDFDVEEGMYWQSTGTTSTRNFLTNQVFPSAVPEPGTHAMWALGLAVMAGAACRRQRSSG